MKITKTKDSVVIELPLFQKSYDAIGEYIGDVQNLIGVDTGREFTISQLCDLAYKGDQQEGMPYIVLEDKVELESVCKQLGLDIWERPSYEDERLKEAVENENIAWCAGHRCHSCGKPMKPSPTSDRCHSCWEKE